MSPLLSRSLLLTLQPLDEQGIATLIDRALTDERGLAGTVTLADDARAHLLRMSGGDAITTVAVRQHGTEMQRVGWEALRRITPGQPLSYTEFAIELGSPQAVRAAASVCARNAPALFVPCHRVLRSDGSLGGFAWGLDVKRSLLEREAAALV